MIRERRLTMDEYLREFERWLPRDRRLRSELRTELHAHLDEAKVEGQLDEALARLGTPREAARTFTAGRRLIPARPWRRALGFLVDVASLVGIGASALPVSILAGGTSGQAVNVEARPPLIFVPELSCTPGPCSGFGAFVFFSLVVGAAFWFVVILTLLEWRHAWTPGKLLAGTRVVSEEGTAITLRQAVIRRLPFFFAGPLQLIDWAFCLFGPTHGRGFDRIARTTVVRVDR